MVFGGFWLEWAIMSRSSTLGTRDFEGRTLSVQVALLNLLSFLNKLFSEAFSVSPGFPETLPLRQALLLCSRKPSTRSSDCPRIHRATVAIIISRIAIVFSMCSVASGFASMDGLLSFLARMGDNVAQQHACTGGWEGRIFALQVALYIFFLF